MGERPPYRPPIGMPIPRERRLGSFLLAVFLHALVVFLLITPFTSMELLKESMGAGGAGPAGGGGGGNRGTGGARERIEFVQVAPAPQPLAPPVVRPPEVKPIIPPPPVEKPKPQETAPQQSAQQAVEASSLVAGTGGGTGNDGTAGSGPGTGGGVGSGVGTGRGSGVGPGTGGGTGTIYPPSLTEMFLPPIPFPARLRGTEVVIVLDVDSTGKVLDFEFTPTRDSGFNRKLREVISQLRFRPAVDGDMPVRAKARISYVIG
jgi:periplasmic protein TonB